MCTCPDGDSATAIARHLVERGLAACVNMVAPVRSVYRWRGEVTEDSETLMLIKTTESRYDELEQAIIANHPYELPEVIAVPIERGFKQYLQWINEQTAR